MDAGQKNGHGLLFELDVISATLDKNPPIDGGFLFFYLLFYSLGVILFHCDINSGC